MWLAPLLLVAMLVLFAGVYLSLKARFPKDDNRLIDAVDALLPQTQCAQCGYPGCRPYAEAIVGGEALNLCPPGGAPLWQALTDLMGAHAGAPPAPTAPAVAVIDESKCIGCALCLPPCPVDAIVGAPNKMHTVISQECTGCELCVPACPVDCIAIEPLPAPAPRRARPRKPQPANPPRSCINCGLCNPACPVELPAQELLHALRQDDLSLAAEQGLAECIVCGLCDRVCPSDIPLADLFAEGRQRLAAQQQEETQKQHYKARYDAHAARLEQARSTAADRRAARLQNANRWT